jgi:DNA polymerase/3'-5' exonuclease PolX
MAYELYVLNQRLPRFPLKDGYPDAALIEAKVSKSFASWLNESMVGNLQRRKACSQAFDFAVWMDLKNQCLESVQEKDFLAFLAESNARELCKFGAFLVTARKRIPELQWEATS